MMDKHLIFGRIIILRKIKKNYISNSKKKVNVCLFSLSEVNLILNKYSKFSIFFILFLILLFYSINIEKYIINSLISNFILLIKIFYFW